MSALLDLRVAATDLRIDGHLPECSHPGRPIRDCDWCLWAVDVPQVRTLLDVLADVRTLRAVATAPTGSVEAAARDSVPWVLAAAELAEHRTRVRVEEVVVASVRGVVGRLASVVDDELADLDRAVGVAVAPGGPVERRCLRTAGALAATRLGQPGFAPLLARTTPAVRSAIGEVTAMLSADSQVEELAPIVDATHWRGLPGLMTQPEWRHRPPPGCGMRRHGPGRHVAAARGSLEALVVESLADRVTDLLLSVADDLSRIGGTVDLVRRVDEPQRSARSRRTLYRLAVIDWHLSLVDSGRADCWPTRDVPGQQITCVPWIISAAIDSLGDRAISTTYVNDYRWSGGTTTDQITTSPN